MNPIPNDVDWSATAAWIALVVSVSGTVLGPIVTALITNRHQIKLRKLDLQEKSISEKYDVLKKCISEIGSVIANSDSTNLTEFGRSYFPAYAYVPKQHWELLDNFYSTLSVYNFDDAVKMYPTIIHLLSSLLISEDTRPIELFSIWRLSVHYHGKSKK